MRIARRNPDLLSNNLKLEINKLWLEINPQVTQCNYYSAPFSCLEEAIESRTGYLEDLL